MDYILSSHHVMKEAVRIGQGKSIKARCNSVLHLLIKYYATLLYLLSSPLTPWDGDTTVRFLIRPDPKLPTYLP